MQQWCTIKTSNWLTFFFNLKVFDEKSIGEAFVFTILSFSNMPTRELLNLTTLRIAYEDINCMKYRRIVYMSWDTMLGKHTLS